MTQEEIYNYQLNQTKKILQGFKFSFDDKEYMKLSEDFVKLINSTINKYSVTLNISIRKPYIDKESLARDLKSVSLAYAIPTILRQAIGGSLSRTPVATKEILYAEGTEGEEVSFNTMTGVLIVGGAVYDLLNMPPKKAQAVVEETLIILGSDKTYEEILRSNKMSSLNKNMIEDNAINQSDSFIQSSVIASIGLTAANRLTTKKWISKKDSRVRHSHEDADGEEVNLFDEFIVGTSRGQYPRDRKLSAKERYNCRCRVEYIIG